MTEDVLKAASFFRTSQDWDDEKVYQALIKEGVEGRRAARLVEFLPIVYSRLILRNSGARFSNKFRRPRPLGGFEEHVLSSDPVWNEALAFAMAELERGVSGQQLLLIAAHSAEFSAANQLLTKGSKLENITFSSPILSWPEDGPGRNSGAV